MMLEMAIWFFEMLMSAAMTSLRSGGKAYLFDGLVMERSVYMLQSSP